MERLRAPELEPALAWLGTPRPLRLRELRGCVVILDFWTACCVNCMHVIPILRDLERRMAGRPVVVIGVHSAKFPAEARPERVREAIARHGVEHPVVVDDGTAIWERYAIRSWPTLVVIRPDGTIAAVAPGEPEPRALDGIVRALLAEAEAAGTLAAAPPPLPREDPAPPGPLRFPGKAVAAADGRAAIADSGHHRVLITDAEGHVLQVIGSGQRGLAEGPFAAARLDDPQGLAWEGPEALWICDARGHAVLRADLAAGRVERVAGTGSMGHVPIAGPGPGRETALRSPWDVAWVRGRALVCLAGSHQLGAVSRGPAGPEVDLLAGGGREALVDGPPRASCYAQPSGLAPAGATLYVADSETSAIRALDLDSGETTTLVGAGLFEFGDADGPLAAARLQHPLGVAALADGALIVADTYNDRLRRIDLAAGAVTTLPTAGLREPGGVSTRPGGGLLVADTGNHRVLRVAADGAIEGELAVRGAPSPERGEEPPAPLGAGPALRWFDLTPPASVTLAPGPATLALRLRAPTRWKLNDGAPLRVALEVSRRSDLVEAPEQLDQIGNGLEDMSLEIALAVAALPADEIRAELLARIDAILCGGDPEVCAPSQAWLRVPLLLRAGGGARCEVAIELAAP